MGGKTTKGQLNEHMQAQHTPRASVLAGLNRQALMDSHSAEHVADWAYGRDVGHEHEGMTKTRIGKVIPGTGLSGGPMAGQDVGDNRATNDDHPANRERNKELVRRNGN
jgi:hypothetical protein